MIQERAYQLEAVAAVRRAAAQLPPGERRIVLQAETGAGKTVMAGIIVAGAVAKGKRALFIARGRRLVTQATAQFRARGLPVGVMMAGEPRDLGAAVQVASKDTLESWCLRRSVADLPPADVVVIDECHESLSGGWLSIIRRYGGSVTLGLSATPVRGDGRGLGGVYRALVQAAPPSRLLAEGHLCPMRIFAPHRPDMSGVHTRNGEWDRDETTQRMDRPKLIGDAVSHWQRLAAGRRTLVFAPRRDCAYHLAEAFTRAGVGAEYMDGETPDAAREAVIDDLEAARIHVVCSVGVLNQGVDIPSVDCILLYDPSRSYIRFRQRCGRGMRPYPGKTDCLLLDHAGAVHMHGFPGEDVEWRLDTQGEACERRPERDAQGKPKTPITCPKCFAVFASSLLCPNCGHELPRRDPEPPVCEHGVLEEQKPTARPHASAEDRRRLWSMCRGVAAARGQRARAAAAMYRQRAGDWPDRHGMPDCPRGALWDQPASVVWPNFCRSQSTTGIESAAELV